MKAFTLFCVFVCAQMSVVAAPHPIGFAIPEDRIVTEIPSKDKDFASLIPGDLSTYIYTTEADYYKDYQRSYFALTWKKGGWDCLRHYEILANGCIPYFVGLENCHEYTMFHLPKQLILEAMNLEGVSYLHIDHDKFDRKRYDELLNELLLHARKHLTTKAMASYLLETIDYSGEGNILYLSQNIYPDYLRCLTLTGLKELFHNKVVDVPKVPHLYRDYGLDMSEIHGKGMTYTKNLEDLPVDRERIEERIANKEFDLVIYGSVHRGTPHLELVQRHYPPEKIVYLCGEEGHSCPFTRLTNFFLREFDDF